MSIISRLLKELKVVRIAFFLAVGIAVLATVTSQLSPLCLRNMIDGPLTQIGSGKDRQVQLLQLAGLYLIAVVLGSALTYLGDRLLAHCGNKVAEHLRNEAYQVMQNLPISYFDDKPAGKIATRIVNDTETLRRQFYSSLVSVLIQVLRIVFTYVLLFYLNPLAASMLLLLLPAFYGIQVFYKKLTDKPMKDFYDSRSDINNQVNELMHGASLIQLYHQEKTVLSEFDVTARKMSQADKQIVWVSALSSWPLTEFLKNAVLAVILTIVGQQFLGGHSVITAGVLFVYLNYIIDLFEMMGFLVRLFPNVQRSLETGKRVLELLDQPQEADEKTQLIVNKGEVVFEHVSFAYEKEKTILHDISFKAKQGETIALVGHTGSGKSSIMNLLYRFYDPQKGKIYIDQQDIQQYSRESLRSHMGIVLQDPYLFTGTLASNVAMSHSGINREKVLEALEKVGARDLLARCKKGIDEPVKDKGTAFSSGERQLISFARTLYANPKILILDEATSHIDTETEEMIQKAMAVVKEGRTTFIIAHRLSTIQDADQILVISEGKIVERGQHDTLVKQNGIYAQMSRLQQQV
ncbi:putative ABC transporter [Streptococcus anginosus]|uniref:ABC transporter ATP-binding protein n=1 Tax=Streptococcus TaxID=1301 RepID=UPI00039075CD|nr:MULTISPECIES: ABC transporter ATP-binding protein [Streptococcus]AGU81595.1 putative ABC transporter [Streptococcus anginosus C1051]MCW1036463.1 ABC transporter ATP-binding protein/permease [Streptococcus anginosus]OHR62802.1 ABC transporter ATP-binding protein [Streptococcus sp. HMSC034B03]PRT74041.1 ABC transporter ATP-binding protein [Streptococcus anginosus]VTS30683.1 putative ABC transporter [Streptococcus anginosus]